MATSPEKAIEDDIRALRDDVAALAKSMSVLAAGADDARAKVGKAASKAMNGAAKAGEDFLSDAASLGIDSVHAAGNVADTTVSALANEIRRNPFVSMLAALGVGYIAGLGQRR